MTARATRRGLLAGGAGLAAHNLTEGQVNAGNTGIEPHPDAELLAVCAELRKLEDKERRLEATVSNDADNADNRDKLTTAADHAWAEFQDQVWPGFDVLDTSLPARLLDLRATTLAGLRAKASAILAMDNLPGLNLRGDSYELNRSVIEDAAALAQAGA